MGKFDLSKTCQPTKRRKTYKATDVVTGPSWVEPPPALVQQLSHGGSWLIGIDIETNDWDTIRGLKGSYGQFGKYSLCAPVDLKARIVQLGWAFGPPGEIAIVKERLVRPIGFEVSEKAHNFHKISHEVACRDGGDLAEVLTEFMTDLLHVTEANDGRMCCHHLEFDAGIIANELERCHMILEKSKFEKIARLGLCTMDPEIGRWVLQCWGDDEGNDASKNTLGLKRLVTKVTPEHVGLLEKHHTAGADALLHRRVAYALCGLSIASCRAPGGGHEKSPCQTIRNGEIWECLRCHERF